MKHQVWCEVVKAAAKADVIEFVFYHKSMGCGTNSQLDGLNNNGMYILSQMKVMSSRTPGSCKMFEKNLDLFLPE